MDNYHHEGKTRSEIGDSLNMILLFQNTNGSFDEHAEDIKQYHYDWTDV